MKIHRFCSISLGIVTIFAILSGTATPFFVNTVYAQGVAPSPTETITTSATPEPSNTTSPEVSVTSETPIEPLVPEYTETPSSSATTTPTFTGTSTPTATSEAATADFYWKVSLEVPITSTELQAFGGVNGGENHLEDTLQTEIQDDGVEFTVETTSVTNSSATYTVELEGNGGIDQFIQTIYSDLENQLNLLNGPIQLKVTGTVTAGQVIPIILESNITTGYLWELVGYDPQLLRQKGEPVFEQKVRGIGAPSRQMITLKAITDGMATITINYRQSFDRGERQTRFIDLSGSLMPEVIDLTNPFQVSSSLPQSPIAAEPAPALESGDPIVGLPATFDWRAEGKVTDVRNQGPCGSCWAFGTVGVMESAILIQSGQAVNLSEQFLVSCNRNGWGCDGGWWAHDYHINTLGYQQSVAGAVLEADMPYTATNGTCRTIANHPYRLTNWYSIAGYSVPSVDQIKNAISSYGPVAAAICTGPAFSGYSGGIFTTNESSTCPSGVNHAIVLTGWDDATQTWVLRNSWGPNWGEAGYMRIRWGTSNVGYASNYVVYTGGSTPTPGGPTPTITSTPQAPNNDDLDQSTTISLENNQFSAIQNITNATNASDDPYFSCVTSRGYKTVWYLLAPSVSGLVTVSTTGSDYDTILGIWQGSRGSLNSIACNDDIASGQLQSQLTFNAQAGQIYMVEAASYNSTGTGNLNLSVNLLPSPTSTATPTATNTFTPTKTRTPLPTLTPRPPVGYGSYDERDVNIVYSGLWNAQNVSGNYANTEKYSYQVGSSAQFTFTGENVTVLYRGYPNVFGNMEVKIDGVVAATVNQNTPSITLQNSWGSSDLGPGVHTIVLTHLDGRYITLDGIFVSGPPTATPTATNTFTPTKTRTPLPTLTPRPPVGYGSYDERDVNIVYSGLWNAQNISGNYANTEKYSYQVGSSAQFTFTGENVTVLYRGYPNVFGNMEVKIDGVVAATVNQNTPSITLQNSWGSSDLGPGVHTIVLTHLDGRYITLDGIFVSGPPTATPTATNTFTPTKTRTPTPTLTPRPPVGYGSYDERDVNIVYSGLWNAQNISGNYANTEKYSYQVGSSAQFTFTGENVTVLYRGYPNVFGNMEVKIDGVVAATVNQNTPSITLQNSWGSSDLGPGVHTIVLTHLDGRYITLDGIFVSGPPTATPTATNTFTPTKTRTPTPTLTPRPPVGYGSYDERDVNIVYSGLWNAQNVSGNYANTEKYSYQVGSSAQFTFTGENVTVLYRGYPNVFGNMEVKIDGSVAATVNQNTASITYQNRWGSSDLGPGVHTIVLTHLDGRYITLDGIIVNME